MTNELKQLLAEKEALQLRLKSLGDFASLRIGGRHTPLHDDADPVTPVLEALKGVEARIQKNMEERIEKKSLGENKELKKLEEQHEQLSQELKGQLDEVKKTLGRLDLTAGLSQGNARKSPGSHLVDSEEFKAVSEDFRTKNGRRFTTRVEFDVKALTTADASAGALVVQPQRLDFQARPTEPHIRDLFAQGDTNATSLVFPVRTAYTNNAAMVPEMGLKPESDMTFDDQTFPVRKMAHYVKVSDELLADAPGFRSYIDAQLIEGLADVEDVQLLRGDGLGNNLTGIYTVARPFTRAVTGDNLVDTFRRAQTQLRLARYTATGILLNPTDLEALELMKGSDSRYLWVSATDGNGAPRLWRMDIRDTTALAAGQWVMGNFRRGAQIFDRQEAVVEATNTDQDDFIRNRVTIRAEKRLALVVFDVNAFVKNAPVV